ncbi:MAG: hypothetical protein ACYTGN_10530 [Planctomycetota bacterium]|jgi:hypothetical protein
MRFVVALTLALFATACSSSKVSRDTEAQQQPAAKQAAAAEPMSTGAALDLSTPEKVVYEILLAMQVEDQAEAFEAYVRLVHPDVLPNEAASAAMRTGVFARLRVQYSRYVHGESKADYVRVRRVPAELKGDVDQVEIHVRDLVQSDTTPAVIILRRYGEEWRIVSNSM